MLTEHEQRYIHVLPTSIQQFNIKVALYKQGSQPINVLVLLITNAVHMLLITRKMYKTA